MPRQAFVLFDSVCEREREKRVSGRVGEWESVMPKCQKLENKLKLIGWMVNIS